MNASEVIEAVECLFPKNAWATLRELKESTGLDRRAIDLFAMSVFPSSGLKRYAIEVKVSRSDFTRELRNYEKSRPWVEGLCNRFAFAAQEGIIHEEDLPPWASLIVIRDGTAYWAVKRELSPKDPPLTFLASILRRQSRSEK